MQLSPSLRTLAQALTDLPSIGPRQAIRLALYLGSLPQAERENIIEALQKVAAVRKCTFCNLPHEEESKDCVICSNSERNKKILMLVEKETDLLSLEKTGSFIGRYLILGSLPRNGALSSWQERQVEKIKNEERFEEIIFALNPTTSGDQQASIMANLLKDSTEKITRLGRGLPRGGEIEFADEETLGHSLQGRG